VGLPTAVLAALPTFVERVKRLRDTQPAVHELFSHSSTPPEPQAGTQAPRSLDVEKANEATRAGESAASICYSQLAGDPCDDVWHRTQRDLGNGNADTNDALHTAFLYVCVQKTYAPPKLCGAFRRKAERWRIDAWRRTRHFRDQPAEAEPACPLPSPEDQAITQEELDLLDDASARLDKRSGQIVHLAYWEGLTDAVIATQLGLSTVRIRVLRREAEKRLQYFLLRCR
jgi:RNA polymerase sigma factor (sigma-70 family)